MKKFPIMLFLIMPLIGLAKINVDTYGSGAKKYWVIYDSESEELSDNLIVFLHGYGASNPACYGGWINDIVTQGHVVVFPKFQSGTFFPRTAKFQSRVDEIIGQTVNQLEEDMQLSVSTITFVSHSIGGVISSNLANQYGQSGKYEVGGLVLVQPGFKYLKLGKLDQYQQINKDAKVILVTGNKDFTAGSKFARHFYNTTPQLKQKVMLTQYGDRNEFERIGSVHKEPISPDFNLDTGNRNLIIVGALMLGRIDQVDKYAYWKITEVMNNCVSSRSCSITPESIPTYMGQWSDNKPIRPMEIVGSR